MTIRYCKDCKHYVHTNSRCTHPFLLDLVMAEPIPASIARRTWQCTELGKLFEPIDAAGEHSAQVGTAR